MPQDTHRQLPQELALPTLSDDELEFIISLIYDECGINLKKDKRPMISARLNKRLRILGMSSFQDYFEYINQADRRVGEIISMVDAITTNKTDFFREDNHFKFLVSHALPELEKSDSFRKEQKVHCWSAGCSTGEEPYTLAMVLDDYFSTRPGDYSVLGTDIAFKVLKKAKEAVYSDLIVAPVPKLFRRRYMMQGKGKYLGSYRVVPELREKVTFGRLNFMSPNYNLGQLYDFIFCRNVVIYFDWNTRVRVIENIYSYLKPGGYLFIGHSETLNGIKVKLERAIPTVFRKPIQ